LELRREGNEFESNSAKADIGIPMFAARAQVDKEFNFFAIIS
jgi:hypothetical protein